MKVSTAIVVSMMFGFLLGWTIRAELATPKVSDQNRYEAYRLCIPKPNCMTADDYIDYYNLKWKLETQE